MSKPISHPSWPAWLLFAFLVVGPPSAVVAFFPMVTHNPFVSASLLVVYEVLVGIGIGARAVINKIWERRGDAWVDAGTSCLEGRLRLLFANADSRYREYFRYEHRDLDMKGISARGTYTLDLEQVFVEIRIDPTPAHKVSSDPIRLPAALNSSTHDIWDYLIHLDQHLVILGAPGSGKTTLLKHLGLCLIQEHHQHKGRARQLPWMIPLFLPLREQSSLLKEQPGCSLVEATERQIRKWKQAIPSEWVEHLLHTGQCLVLLDGLDEIAEKTQRQQMVDWVQQQMLAYPKSRFVITSRPLGYQTTPLEHVAVLDVQPFTFEQITRFLYAWYLANEIKRSVRDDPGVRMKAQEDAEDLLKRLHTTPTLFVMAVNPLLLTMIATVHLYYGKLPGARITLYKAICEVFLSRRAEVPGNLQELRAEQRQLVLQSLAYALMQQEKRELSRETACSLLAGPLQMIDTTFTPQLFLDHLETICSGLFLEREQGVYSFAHQTFQEYLAMIHLQEQHLEQELLTHVEESWWHETLLLYCAQADATAILEACINQSLPSLEALTLAIDCIEEARTVKAEVKERLYALLEQGINDADSERRRVIAGALLKRRLRQMRPLKKGIFVDTSLVTCAEYQLFVDEQRTHGQAVAPDIWNWTIFPQNHGQDALVGVCERDAKAFCSWLMGQDLEGYSYRLPREEERLLIKTAIGAGFSQDTCYREEDGSLIWSQPGPSDSLYIQVFSRLPIYNADNVQDLARTLALEGVLTLEGSLDRAHALDHVRARALELDHVLVKALDRDRNRARVSKRELDRGLARARIHSLALARERSFELVLDLTQALDHAYALAHALSRASAHGHALDLARAYALEIYSILFLFVQRPQGMLPAYESILLIKERLPNTTRAS